jgi:hypothetical protein
MHPLLKWLFDLIPFAIASLSLAMARGWILVRPDDPEFSQAWRKKNQALFVTLAAITALVGIACVLVEAGILKTQP